MMEADYAGVFFGLLIGCDDGSDVNPLNCSH
jgi:hypothetical protein